jgi:hypothetical protein
MPTYVVVVEGSGFRLPSAPEPIVGFMASRRVRAINEQSAIDEAKRLIIDEWHSSGYEAENIGDLPSLTVDSVWSQGLLQRVFSRVPKKGYTFFSRG